MYRTSRNPMRLEDNELVIRAKNGEMVAFEELISRYDRRILGIALRFTNDMDQAQDLYQEIFLRVHNGLKQFKMQSKFSTWLYRIATNACLSHLSSQSKKREVSIEHRFDVASEDGEASMGRLPEALVTQPDSDRLAESAQISEHISRALKRLSPQQRLVFVLRHYDGRKLKEIASMLRCAEGTVKKHLFTATLRMREELRTVYH